MKKFMAIILAVLMMFSFAACGENEKEDSKSNNDSYDSADDKNNLGDENDNFITGESTPEIGKYITFGSYEQDNDTSNGKEEIEWLVLDKQDDKILVISKYALDCHSYNDNDSAVTWETCTLRAWLNDNFYNSAFNETEKADIISTNVPADPNPEFDTDAGNTTQDNLFLLSITEANKYFASNEERICQPTEYALAQGASDNYAGNSRWLLRTPGSDNDYASSVYYEGDILSGGGDITKDNLGVRPAMWIEL